MSKKDRNFNKSLPSDIRSFDRFERELSVHKSLLIDKALRSDDPESILAAQDYIRKLEEHKASSIKSFTIAPDSSMYSGLGFRRKHSGLSYELLRQMARTPQIAAVIQTRLDQSADFNKFTTDNQKRGWSIRKVSSIFSEEKDRELSKQDKLEIEAIVKWLEDGGSDINEWEGVEDFSEFRKKVYKDSWELDQGCFEISWRRNGIPYQYQSVDGATIRLAEIIKDQNEESDGIVPKYVQVWQNRLYKHFYPFEMCMGMRNCSTNVYNNGYSVSELEILIQIITWILFGMQYNGNFFQQGSNPKGLLNVKNNVDPTKMEELRQSWRNMITGNQNSQKIAVMGGVDLEWINFQMANKDMEFNQWNEFLTIIACTVFRIDPDEVGFRFEGGKSPFGQDGQKKRIEVSREKGLIPFMKYWETQLNKYLIKPLSKGKYEFYYTGIDIEDEDKTLQNDVTKLEKGMISLEDVFMKYSGRKLDLAKDTILNSIALQYRNAKMEGGEESNKAVEEMEKEENPFKKYGLNKSEDPYFSAFNDYLEKSNLKSE